MNRVDDLEDKVQQLREVHQRRPDDDPSEDKPFYDDVRGCHFGDAAMTESEWPADMPHQR